ncbi:hypothetical protein NMY22_g10826 [Coprinellus aureogranulatus]|nr:hypothetical protein NMY22_g10826 [Coprinellus aureogranulatus]
MKPALKRAAAVFRRRPPATEPPAEGGGKRIKERLRLGLDKLRTRRVPFPILETSSISEASLVDTAPVGHSSDVASPRTSAEGDPVAISTGASFKTGDRPSEIRCQVIETHGSAPEYSSAVTSNTTAILPTPSPPSASLPPASNSNFLSGVQNARVGTLEVMNAGRDTVRNTQFIFNSPIISFGTLFNANRVFIIVLTLIDPTSVD